MRRLSAEEQALWDKVAATVRPMQAARIVPEVVVAPEPAPKPVKGRVPPPRAVAAPPAAARPKPGETLDGGWDKRLARGLVQPDATVDLHGHNLSTAYATLDDSLTRAVGRGDRLILLITGKPPRDDRRPVARGAIRAAVGDWLAASPHAGSIAAVRGAHPRHGGSGALYIVLRRKR